MVDLDLAFIQQRRRELHEEGDYLSAIALGACVEEIEQLRAEVATLRRDTVPMPEPKESADEQ